LLKKVRYTEKNYMTYTRSYTNDLQYHRKKPTLQHNITNNNMSSDRHKKKPVTGQKKPTIGYIIFSVYSFFLPTFFRTLNNHTSTYQKIRQSLFFGFFFNIKNHIIFLTFSMIFAFYLHNLDIFRFNLETFPYQVSNILVQKEFFESF
jgi:hypothetical protein